MLYDLIKRNRSYRRFHENHVVDTKMLAELIECARLAPSGRNLQPLRYILINDPMKNALVFSRLKWAGYLPEWGGPKEGERPSAYIIMLGDTTVSKGFDTDIGIAAQTILLAAVEKDLGGCMIASAERDKLRVDLAIPERYDICLVIALGKPKELVVVEEIKPEDSIKYWREDNGTHHVPKRKLDDIIIK